jgi:hypothetical protein
MEFQTAEPVRPGLRPQPASAVSAPSFPTMEERRQFRAMAADLPRLARSVRYSPKGIKRTPPSLSEAVAFATVRGTVRAWKGHETGGLTRLANPSPAGATAGNRQIELFRLFVMIVQILISKRDPERLVADQGRDLVARTLHAREREVSGSADGSSADGPRRDVEEP